MQIYITQGVLLIAIVGFVLVELGGACLCNGGGRCAGRRKREAEHLIVAEDALLDPGHLRPINAHSRLNSNGHNDYFVEKREAAAVPEDAAEPFSVY